MSEGLKRAHGLHIIRRDQVISCDDPEVIVSLSFFSAWHVTDSNRVDSGNARSSLIREAV